MCTSPSPCDVQTHLPVGPAAVFHMSLGLDGISFCWLSAGLACLLVSGRELNELLFLVPAFWTRVIVQWHVHLLEFGSDTQSSSVVYVQRVIRFGVKPYISVGEDP